MYKSYKEHGVFKVYSFFFAQTYFRKSIKFRNTQRGFKIITQALKTGI